MGGKVRATAGAVNWENIRKEVYSDDGACVNRYGTGDLQDCNCFLCGSTPDEDCFVGHMDQLTKNIVSRDWLYTYLRERERERERLRG